MAASPEVMADYNVLKNLYRLTGGNHWTYSRNWNSFARLEHWDGVRVDDEGRVVELILNDNNLKGIQACILALIALYERSSFLTCSSTESGPFNYTAVPWKEEAEPHHDLALVLGTDPYRVLRTMFGLSPKWCDAVSLLKV